AFEHDLGARRQRETREIADEDFDGRARDAGIILVLAFGLGQARGRDQKQQRIDAVASCDRHRLAQLPPFLALDGGGLARRGVDADLARAFDHHAVGADVDAAGLRILSDDGVAGAEIEPTIERPHALRRKHANVDLLALEDVLIADRLRGGHLARRQLAPELLLQRLHRLERMIDWLLPDHQAEARKIAADHVVERLVAGMAFDVLEQQRGRFAAADQIGDGRGLEVGIDLRGDALELAERLDLLEPEIEIAGIGGTRYFFGFGPVRLIVRTDRDTHVHGAAPALTWVHGSRSRRVGKGVGTAFPR